MTAEDGGTRDFDRLAAGMWEDAAANSRWRGRVGVPVREGDGLTDLVGVWEPDLEGVCFTDLVAVRVATEDLVFVPVDLGDLLGDTGTHAPHVEGM